MLEYKGIKEINGPLIVIEGIKDVGYGEMVDVISQDGRRRSGKVIDISEKLAVVQVFEGTDGLIPKDTKVRFRGKTLRIPVSEEMRGRIFNGIGEPIDGGPPVTPEEYLDINGLPLNPVSRAYPRDYIQTGISAIDGNMTLIRGQKLPIFSGDGLPHNEIAAQIARQAKISEEENAEFSIVFAAMGIKHDTATFFKQSFQESGALKNVIMFLNLADDPVIERIVTPRCALTAAEYLAFKKDMHILVIMIDMTNYCEALREMSSRRGEVPARKGYPGYMYSDLATIYERAGRIIGKRGSITQIPILTMPNDDITNPVPDLTGYITEGQIVLSRDLYNKGIYPPINILPSLSRLMKDGIGKGRTREDHPNLSAQLYAAYAHSQEVRNLASVIGEEELNETERLYLKFGEEFERKFINQGMNEERTMEETLNLGWEVLSILPRSELYRLTEAELNKYYKKELVKDEHISNQE